MNTSTPSAAHRVTYPNGRRVWCRCSQRRDHRVLPIPALIPTDREPVLAIVAVDEVLRSVR